MFSTALHHYRLRKLSSEKKQHWDEFVDAHPSGHFLQSWGWGELKAEGGWSPLRLALYDEEKQQIVGTAQVLCRTAPHVPLWAGHLAYIPKGPVIDWSQSLLCESFFEQLHAYLRKRGALALHMEPGQILHIANDDDMRRCLASTFLQPAPAIQPLRTIILNLAADETTLLAGMKEKWRYNVRLAQRKGVTVRVAQTVEDVQAWYNLMQTTSERDQFGIHTLDYYLQAWRIFAPRGQARLFLAEYQGQLLAGIFVSLFARQGTYLYGASSNEHRNLMPNYLLQWEAIRWSKQEGATHYDFWGIPPTDSEDEAMAGVYRFKSGWGGEVVRFVGCYEHVYRQRRMKMVRGYLPE